jgi:hypothetical protein
MKLKILFSLALLSALSLPSNAINQDADWIENTPNAPLLLVAKGQSLTVQNVTDKAVQSYQLGCVRKRDTVHIVHRFPLQKIAVLPSGRAFSAAFDGPPEEQIKCQTLKAKLSLLETTFQDGTTWHLADDSLHKRQNLGPREKPAEN